jgi:hypothetical protein
VSTRAAARGGELARTPNAILIAQACALGRPMSGVDDDQVDAQRHCRRARGLRPQGGGLEQPGGRSGQRPSGGGHGSGRDCGIGPARPARLPTVHRRSWCPRRGPGSGQAEAALPALRNSGRTGSGGPTTACTVPPSVAAQRSRRPPGSAITPVNTPSATESGHLATALTPPLRGRVGPELGMSWWSLLGCRPCALTSVASRASGIPQ